MKIFLDQTEVLDLTPTQMNLLRHMIPADQVEERIKGMIYQILGQCLRDCAMKLFDEWRPKFIAEGTKMIPVDDVEIANLIFARADYLPAYAPKNNMNIPEIGTVTSERAE